MKKYIILLFVALFATYYMKAQVLYSENFDNLTIGNVGTDVTGQTPGQGGWYTKGNNQYTQKNNLFTIENETNRGKVLVTKIVDMPFDTFSTLTKSNINQLIDQRYASNNVIKFELEYFTGQIHPRTINSNSMANIVNIYFVNSKNVYLPLIRILFYANLGELKITNYDGAHWAVTNILNNTKTTYPLNTWLKINVYIDYNNNFIYFDIPYYGKVFKKAFINQAPFNNLIQEYKPAEIVLTQSTSKQITTTYPMINKYNDIKITALNNVPLSVSEFLNEKFNVFPNPATNIVNITNDDNITVDKINIYDLSGKLIKETNYNTENTIQLNIEHLQSGNYLLHLETNLGTAIKKIIKQ